MNFWTYGCVNALPHVVVLNEKYKDRGLVVVGVHTPEFPFERSASNVQAALRRHGITYPVAQDNDSRTWLSQPATRGCHTRASRGNLPFVRSRYP